MCSLEIASNLQPETDGPESAFAGLRGTFSSKSVDTPFGQRDSMECSVRSYDPIRENRVNRSSDFALNV
jgi:hypothetical protein